MAYGLKACSCHPLKWPWLYMHGATGSMVYVSFEIVGNCHFVQTHFVQCHFVQRHLSPIPNLANSHFGQCHLGQNPFRPMPFRPKCRPSYLCDLITFNGCLTAHNWQKWKGVFLTCPCHEIYRDEAVGLKSCKYTWKIYLWKCEIWGNILKVWYFVNNCFIEARI